MSYSDLVIVIAGPTASGKSALAMKLVQEFAQKKIVAEIISADSISVFKDFNIGSAKPSPEERKAIPHHLIDICEAEENFTAADFSRSAEPIIHKLHQEKKIPIICGGTGFYLRSLLQGMTEESPEESLLGKNIKAELEQKLKENGAAALYQEMLQLDPILEGNIHPNDEYRILRALQAMKSTGKKWSALNKKAKEAPPRFSNVLFFCIEVPKEILKENVKARTLKMLKDGFMEEVKSIRAKHGDKAKALQSVGYKECMDFLTGKIKEENLADAIVLGTTQLAKKQMTWFRGEKNFPIHWLKYDKNTDMLLGEILLHIDKPHNQMQNTSIK